MQTRKKCLFGNFSRIDTLIQKNESFYLKYQIARIKWDKVFINGPSKICGRQPLRILLGPFLNSLSQVIVPLKILVLISINVRIGCLRLPGLPLNSGSQWKQRPLL